MSMLSGSFADEPPLGAGHRISLPLIGLLLAGALVGLALILWIAANWHDLGKFGRFAFVATIIGVAALAGILSEKLRAPSALVGVLAIGGMFALIGQTYQSSSNAYELFAIWAAVALPWVIAARHDAVWSLWTLVAFTALPLWLSAHSAGPLHASIGLVPMAWAIAIALCLLLSPLLEIEKLTGPARWAFRLAVVLTLSLVVTYTVPAIFSNRTGLLVPFFGFLIVGAAAAGFSVMQPFSLALLAAAALAIDILAISALSKMLVSTRALQGGFLLLGIMCAGIVAGSAVMVLNIAKSRNNGVLPGVGSIGPISAQGAMSTWPVAVLSGIGALFASLPILIFLGLTFGSLLAKGAGVYIIGGVIIAGSIAGLRGASDISFRQQLSFIFLVIGLLLLSFGIFRDMPAVAAAAALLAGCVGLAVIIRTRWIVVLLGSAAAALFVYLVSVLFIGRGSFYFQWYVFRVTAYLIAAALGAAALVIFRNQPAENQVTSNSELLDSAQGFVTGWCAAILSGLMIGNPTFLLSGGWGRLNHFTQQSLQLDLAFTMPKVAAVLLVLATAAYLAARLPAWRTIPAFAIGAVIAALAYVLPPVAGAFVIFGAALATGRRTLTILAAFALIWLLGAFYYWLGWPLISKAYLLGALGLALGAVVLLSPGGSEALPSHTSSPHPTGSAPVPVVHSAIAAMLIALAVLATASTAGPGIWQREQIVTHGRRILIELAPVDPRSLMRGDYMALRFKAAPLPRIGRKSQHLKPPTWAVASVSPDGVADIKTYADDSDSTVSGDIVLRISVQNRQVVIGTNAYFFKEGDAAKYAAARYGEFRVGSDGTPILIGLADAARRTIN